MKFCLKSLWAATLALALLQLMGLHVAELSGGSWRPACWAILAVAWASAALAFHERAAATEGRIVYEAARIGMAIVQQSLDDGTLIIREDVLDKRLLQAPKAKGAPNEEFRRDFTAWLKYAETEHKRALQSYLAPERIDCNDRNKFPNDA